MHSYLIAAHEAAAAFSLDFAVASRVRQHALSRHAVRGAQLRAYFDLLLRLARKTDSGERSGLFDRIERTLAEMERFGLSEVPRAGRAA
jgi:hypothetical protein